MSQAEVSKISAYIGLIPPADAVTVPKLSLYVWLMPGSDTGDDPDRQGFCYAQRFRRS